MVDSKLGKRLERRKDKKPLGPGACGIGEIEGGYLEMKTRCRVAEKNKESAVAFVIAVAEEKGKHG